jgi:hypothetical protein
LIAARILLVQLSMRYVLAVTILGIGLAAATTSFAQEPSPPVPPPVLSDQQLLRKYVWSTLGPPGVIGAAFVGGFEQWQGHPAEWGGGMSGYSKRWASGYAAAAIGNTTKYTVARLMHQDPSFTRCQCTGFGPRSRHAIKSLFVARTRDGRQVFSVATVAAQAAEHVIPASVWYPDGRVMSDGVARAVVGVVSKLSVNLVREFVDLPRLPHKP